MPTADFGVYKHSLVAGTEVSSTYEGRHVTIKEEELVHPTRGTGLVVKGDPVVFGTNALQGVGVAFKSAAAATDLIAIDTEGIWNLNVLAQNDAGNLVIRGGAPLYINTTTCIISAIKDPATQVPFGYALGQVATGVTARIAVKVHWDPKCHSLLEDEPMYFASGSDSISIAMNDSNSLEILPETNGVPDVRIGNGVLSMDFYVFGSTANNYMIYESGASALRLYNTTMIADGRVAEFYGTCATPAMPDGSAMTYNRLTLTGVATGFASAFASWINLQGDVSLVAGMHYSALQAGVWNDGKTLTDANIIFGVRMHNLTGSGFGGGRAFPFSLNTNNHGITALFECMTTTDLGIITNAGADDGTLVPLLRDNGGNMRYVKIYTAA